ncbi:Urb2/Npa2 family-domain-containing protein [Talaromyces proteolyticus]|uniref:Urb2/Npa2 family-domain-containing protein n=1 Tax=Talaromyces proteolyticus TaxID=1131652 RepID=A0AAD4Q190_9EURO|nr:Urb2/Npa2 family-domain-containing protein [Talaromyces proteolyticus]KAH8698459.1 Urb2/Npa2 family-domain-containing protein [Talaromyces proteolyticus]
MAPIKDAVGSSQEALLSLEKSTANSDTQLNNAARIIKLDLLSSTDLAHTKPDLNTKPAPKEEWVLRWLLKRFKSKPYRLQPLSYVLLQKLIQRIPPKAIAVIFTDYKFSQLVKDIVEDLENAVFASLRDDTVKVPVPSGSETSTTLNQSPIRSKKRKRGENTANRDEDILGFQQPRAAVDAYVNFLDFLFVLTTLVNSHENSGSVSQIHLRQALRTESAFVAPILGKLFRASAYLVAEFAKEKRSSELQRLIKASTAVFILWELSRSNVDGTGKNNVNVAFSDHCFVESMRLYLLVLSIGGVPDGADFIVHSIEKLIALHVVLPARNAFMDAGGLGIDYSKDDDPDWSAVQPVTATFRPLLAVKSSENVDCSGIETPPSSKAVCIFAPTWKPAELVPTFYNIIARSVPRDSFRRQANEASWLETAFVALAELAYSMTKDKNGNISGFIPQLEQLFIVVRACNIKLSLHTFLTHAAYTGLLKGKDRPQEVHWGLTALLIELGVDIFLPNSGFKDSKRLLDALCQTLYHIRNDQVSRQIFQTVKANVVIPLLRAFAGARDLPSFITLWREQLRDIEIARGAGDSKDTYSVWEDDDLGIAFREVMKISLSEAQFRSQLQSAMAEVTSTTGAISNSPELYASVVLLEISSNVWGQHGVPGLETESVTGLAKAINKSLLLRDNVHWKWRLWRLAKNLLPTSLKNPLNGPNDLAQSLEKRALRVMQSAYEQQNPVDLRECFEACRFLLQITRDLQHISPNEETVPQSLLDNVTGLFKTLIASEKKGLLSWNGRIEDIRSPSQLGIAYVVCIMEFPGIWHQVPSKSAENFIHHLLLLAGRTKQHVKNSESATFYQLWEVMVSYEYLLDIPKLCSSIVQVLFRDLQTNSAHRALVLSFLPRIPIRLHGVDGAKEVMASFLNEHKLSPESIPDAISLMAKWCWESAQIDHTAREWIASNLPLQCSTNDIYTLRSYRSLVETVFEGELEACKSTELHKFLKRYYKIASHGVSDAVEMEAADQNRNLSLKLVLVGVLLRLLSVHCDELNDPKLLKDITRQRRKMFQSMLNSLDSCKQLLDEDESNNKAAIGLATTLYVLEEFQDLLQQKEKASRKLTDIYKNIPRISDKWGHYLQKIIQQQLLRGVPNEDRLTLDDPNVTDVVNLRRLYAEDQQRYVQVTTAQLEAMNNEGRIKTIRKLRSNGFYGPIGSCRLMVAGLAVSCLDDIPEKGSAEARELSFLCTALTDTIQDSQAIEQFSLAAECLDILLRLHPRGVSQYNIDKCLSTVSKTMSKLSSLDVNEVSPEFASTVYTRFCRLMGTLFGLYRQQLGGRFHILTPALQALLKALFAPSRKRKRDAGSSRLSPMHRALGIPHAVMFSRLLSSLCDPTVSAVSRPTRGGASRDGLIDQTKTAKLKAGQHLRIIIESYAQHMLDSPISAEMKAALLPGLYAVLDAMPTDTKRALNASMDVSSRAIFKTLHDDYISFGKWNNKG